MKRMTLEQVETAKARAEVAALSLQGDDERADEFAAMTPEEYAELRGIEIVDQNPAPEMLALVNPNRKLKKGGKKSMPRETLSEKCARLEARVQELEDERLDALEALGVEIIDDDEDLDGDEEDEDAESEDDENGES